MPDKETEHWYLRWLQELGGPMPAGRVEPFEAPDFLIHSPDGTVGIEVTELYHPQEEGGGSPRQEQEELRRRALRLAREIHDRSGGRPVQAAVFFSKALRRARVEPVDRLALEKGSPSGPILPAEVDQIYVAHIPGFGSRWTNPWAATIPTLEPPFLQELLDRKERRLPTYRAHCDSVWLLIGIDRFPLSKYSDISPAVALHPFRSTFDRVFIVDNAERQLVELRLEPTIVLARA